MTFVGGIADREVFGIQKDIGKVKGGILDHNPFVKGVGRAKYPYDYTWYMQDGSVLQLAAQGTDVRELRYDFNPNRWESPGMKDRHVMSILRLMKNVSLTRIDIAIDVGGVDLGKYTLVDLKARKRETHQDGTLNVETIYVGSARADRRLRIYNKNKQLQDIGKIDTYDKNDHYWRVEAQLRGEEANEYMNINPFSDITFIRKYSCSDDLPDYDLKLKALLYYLSHHPEEMDKLSKNTRNKYKNLLAATSQQLDETSFAEVYEKSKSDINETVKDYRGCTQEIFLEG